MHLALTAEKAFRTMLVAEYDVTDRDLLFLLFFSRPRSNKGKRYCGNRAVVGAITTFCAIGQRRLRRVEMPFAYFLALSTLMAVRFKAHRCVYMRLESLVRFTQQAYQRAEWA